TTIGEEAFDRCKSLTSVTIPDSVATIGKWAFLGFENLSRITIPDSVKRIEWEAFMGCRSLKTLTIGKDVRKIGYRAFKDCKIDTIVCCPQVPPKINDSFDRFENLIVPTGCEEAYANSDWGQYLE
ncbi:MAG: leucine-rich repeat domain-containing protein, partial [Alistipes sp.]|nr:leucine-rich repeat domain-containing protein [Alistipes sp.]